jgi:hypothetical protein
MEEDLGEAAVEAQSLPPSSVPRRPKSLEPTEIGFAPQPFIRWFHPFELARAGVRTALAAMFGAYADRRELQAALNAAESTSAYRYVTLDVDDPASAPRRTMWVDFVAWPGASAYRARRRADPRWRRGVSNRLARRLRAAHRRTVPRCISV